MWQSWTCHQPFSSPLPPSQCWLLVLWSLFHPYPYHTPGPSTPAHLFGFGDFLHFCTSTYTSHPLSNILHVTCLPAFFQFILTALSPLWVQPGPSYPPRGLVAPTIFFSQTNPWNLLSPLDFKPEAPQYLSAFPQWWAISLDKASSVIPFMPKKLLNIHLGREKKQSKRRKEKIKSMGGGDGIMDISESAQSTCPSPLNNPSYLSAATISMTTGKSLLEILWLRIHVSHLADKREGQWASRSPMSPLSARSAVLVALTASLDSLLLVFFFLVDEDLSWFALHRIGQDGEWFVPSISTWLFYVSFLFTLLQHQYCRLER